MVMPEFCSLSEEHPAPDKAIKRTAVSSPDRTSFVLLLIRPPYVPTLLAPGDNLGLACSVQAANIPPIRQRNKYRQGY